MKQLQQFKQQLLTKKENLLLIENGDDDATKIVKLDQSRVGRLSRMDALQGQAMSLEIKRRRQIEMQKINAALKRISDNEYGVCLVCDEEIAMKRLQLDPAATLCITCAENQERSN